MNINSGEEIFNSEDAILLAAMCYQTYLHFESGKLILPKGYELKYTINANAGVDQPKEAVFGFIAESEDKIILAFRGTDALLDADSDLDLFQVQYPFVKDGGKTHRGITNIYQSTRDILLKKLNELSTKKALLITGHSLGGSLAILASLDIAVNTGFKNLLLYTFAASRVGDPVFVERFNQEVKNSVRIYNVHDFIPTLPAEEYPAPFTEEGLVYQHVDTKYPLSFQLDRIILNHKINNYYKYVSETNPAFAKELNDANPGFCPATTV